MLNLESALDGPAKLFLPQPPHVTIYWSLHSSSFMAASWFNNWSFDFCFISEIDVSIFLHQNYILSPSPTLFFLVSVGLDVLYFLVQLHFDFLPSCFGL